MSVLIPGMEMPKSCSVCPMLEGDRMDGLCHAASKWLDDDEHWTWYVYPEGDMDDSKPCNCPLVPVPPHGRLIDADALEMERMAENARKGWHDSFAVVFNGDPYYEAAYDCTEQLKELVNNAPTIIPADPAEEGEG